MKMYTHAEQLKQARPVFGARVFSASELVNDGIAEQRPVTDSARLCW